jgi:hypothetical protein
VVSEDGSPHGPKSFVLWNPPFAAPDRKGSGGKGLNMSHTEGRKRGGVKRFSLTDALQRTKLWLVLTHVKIRQETCTFLPSGIIHTPYMLWLQFDSNGV